MLVAVTSLVNVGRALPDERNCSVKVNRNLVAGFVFGIFIEGFGAAGLFVQWIERR